MDKTLFIKSGVIKEVTQAGSKGLRIQGYANTSDRDRSGDIVLPGAWAKGIEAFRKNPIILNQHKRDQPIGRVEKIRVDSKGIYVDAYISDAAEKLYGLHSLIKQGVIKAFSVGFKPKKGRHDRKTDTTYITELELHEISIVSIPANADTLFSVRKSFEDEIEYNVFMDSLLNGGTKEFDFKEELTGHYKAGISSRVNDHYHTFEVDENGNGTATYTSHGKKHFHKVNNFVVKECEDHTHEIDNWVETNKEIPTLELDETDAVLSFEDIIAESTEKEDMANSEKDTSTAVEDIVTETPVEVIEETSEEVNKKTITEEEEVTETPIEEPVEEQVVAKEVEETSEEKDDDEDEIATGDPLKSIPFVNLLSLETSEILKGTNVKLGKNRYVVQDIATTDNPFFSLDLIDNKGEGLDDNLVIKATNLAVLNTWDIGSSFDIELLQHNEKDPLTEVSREEIKEAFDALVNVPEAELYDLRKAVSDSPTNQRKLNNLLNLKATTTKEWTDTDFIIAKRICNTINHMNENMPASTSRDFNLLLHGHKSSVAIKETEDMATQEIGDPVVVDTKKSQAPEPEAENTPRIEVSEPRVAELIKETGQAIMDQSLEDEKAQDAGRDPVDSEELKELRSQNNLYKDQIVAMSNNKMLWQENNRPGPQFTDMEMANALFLAKGLGREDVFDTTYGNRMKAVTTVDAFLSNFSTTVFEEMQQQLVIAPLFNRMQVDARTFRVPVSDEDTDGDVAQFPSGTFVTGPWDDTNVPATNQHVIKAVEFAPHKWMATTHLAKDEEEDTILPLIDFLRASAARRIARAIDKSLLRGDGALGSFKASPTNSISVGGGIESVIKGITTLCTDVGAALQVDSGSGNKVDPPDIAAARAKLGKYGLQLGDQLVFLTTIEGYNDLVQTSDFRTVDKFGPNATYLTGSLGAVYGIPVIITEFLDNAGSSSDLTGLLLYKPGFMIAERRAMLIESEYNPRQQATAVYLSTRMDMHALTTDAVNGALNSSYSFAVVIRSA